KERPGVLPGLRASLPPVRGPNPAMGSLLRSFLWTGRRRCASAHAAATEQVDDGEQDDRADQRRNESHDVEACRSAGAAADERGDEPAADQCTDDADDHVEQDPLLGVRPHDQAGEPADDAAHDQPNDQTHVHSPYARFGGKGSPWGRDKSVWEVVTAASAEGAPGHEPQVLENQGFASRNAARSAARGSLPVALRGRAATRRSGRGRNTGSTAARSVARMRASSSPGATASAASRHTPVAGSGSSGNTTPSSTPAIACSRRVRSASDARLPAISSRSASRPR